MAKILYIDDNRSSAYLVREWLKREGHLLEIADSGEDGLQLCRNFEFDMIILDWSLPGISGLEVCEEFRRRGGTSWVYILSELNQVDRIELALDSGADDYICKPVDLRELSARIRRTLRRSGTELRPELRIGDVLLDVSRRTLSVNNQTIALTPKEAALLEYLMRHPNKFVSTNKLLAAVWPSGCSASGGTVRTFMRNLRQKLDAAGKVDLIKTVLGSGYTIEAAGHGTYPPPTYTSH